MAFKQRLAQQLRPQLNRDRGLTITNKAIIALILAAVMIAILETEESLAVAAGNFFFVAEVIIFVVFLIEYVARLYVANVPTPDGATQSRLRYALSKWALMDLAVLVSFVFQIYGSTLFILRLMRLLRILRLARLGRFSNSLNLIITSVMTRRYEICLTFFFALFLMVVCATVLYIVEAPYQPEDFGSIPRALWWSIATLTTVGYGDVTPITTLGKISAGATAIIGIGLVALPAGILASAFSEALQKQRKNDRD
ncbi:ion transporter [Aliidiomarina sp. Khilg15.8]